MEFEWMDLMMGAAAGTVTAIIVNKILYWRLEKRLDALTKGRKI